MQDYKPTELLRKGIVAVDREDMVTGLALLEATGTVFLGNPVFWSYFAVCLAKVRRDFSTAVELCTLAIKINPKNPLHYVNLGRVYLAEGDKENAIRALHNGLSHCPNNRIQTELNKFGRRKPPIVSMLKRSHPLNIFLGKLAAHLELR